MHLCQVKWGQLGHDPEGLEDLLREHEPMRLRIGKDGRGRIKVMVVDRAWADDWARHYGTEMPHHGHFLQQAKPSK